MYLPQQQTIVNISYNNIVIYKPIKFLSSNSMNALQELLQNTIY